MRKPLSALEGLALCQAKLNTINSNTPKGATVLLKYFPCPFDNKQNQIYPFAQILSPHFRNQASGFALYLANCSTEDFKTSCRPLAERLLSFIGLFGQENLTLDATLENAAEQFVAETWLSLLTIFTNPLFKELPEGEKIVAQTFDMLSSVLESKSEAPGQRKVLAGILKATAKKGFKLEEQRHVQLIGLLAAKAKALTTNASPIAERAVLTIARVLCDSPALFSASISKLCTDLACHVLESKGPGVAALDLIEQIIVLHPEAIDFPVQVLKDFIASYFVFHVAHSEKALGEYRKALGVLAQVSLALESKVKFSILNRTSEFFLNQLLESVKNLSVIPQYNTLRNMMLDDYCLVFRQLASSNPEAAKPVFTTLYSQFYLAHENFLKGVQGIEQGTMSSTDKTASATSERPEKYDSGKQKYGSFRIASRSMLISGSGRVDPNVEEDTQRQNLVIHFITVQGRLARALFDAEETIQLMASRFLPRILYPPTAVDDALISQCMQFCLLGIKKPYIAIITEFTNIFKRIVNDPESERRNVAFSNLALPTTLTNLAKQLPTGLRSDMLDRLLNLFLNLAQDVVMQTIQLQRRNEQTHQSTKRKPSSKHLQGIGTGHDKYVPRNLPSVQALGYLLPTLAELLRNAPPFHFSGPFAADAKLFRGFWYYCTLFQFVDATEWRSDWAEEVHRIGALLPPLVSTRPHLHAQMDKERQAILANFGEKDIVPYKDWMRTHLPDSAAFVKTLSPSDTLYILAIYHLEVARATYATYTPSFAYLEDPGLPHTATDFAACLKLIASKARSVCLRRKDLSLESAFRLHETECLNLLTKICSVYPEAAKLAAEHLEVLVTTHPEVTWTRTVLKKLFYLIENVGIATEDHRKNFIELPEGKIPLKEESKDLKDLQQTLKSLAKTYIHSGIKNAPHITLTILQAVKGPLAQSAIAEILSGMKVHGAGTNMMAELSKKIDACRTHMGAVRGAVELLSEGAAPVPATAAATTAITTTSTLAPKAEITLNSSPSPNMSSFKDSTASNSVAESQRKARGLVAQRLLQTLSELHVRALQGEYSPATYERTMYQASALLIEEGSSSGSGATLPLVHFVSRLPVVYFTEHSVGVAVECWTWVATMRPELEDLLMLQISEAWVHSADQKMGIFCDRVVEVNPVDISRHAAHPPFSSHRPHRVFLDFLQERVKVCHTHKITSYLFKIFRRSVAANFSSSTASLGTRFKLLAAVLEFCHSGKLKDQVKENLLREMAYQNCLAFYCQKAGFYEPEARHANQESASNDSTSNLALGCESDLDILSQFLGELNKEESFEKTPNAVRLFDSRAVMISLLTNDIERLSVWENPLARFSQPSSVQGARKYSVESTVRTAWRISPKLAFSVAARFQAQGLSQVYAFLQEQVLLAPRAVIEIPEAVLYLVSQHNVAADIPQLQHLLYWAPVDPPTALSLLYKDYNAHPTLTLYAVRVLLSFEPETIIYYIPQLIQALRYDKTGEVLDYLQKAATTSDLLAHQLIWNCQTYTEAEETTPELKLAAGKLAKQIVAQFSPASIKIYNEVFSFMDEVTQVSAYLLEKGQNKDERQPFLAPKLRELNIKAGPLYLPTNPNTKVHGVVPEKSVVLQSSKKAPILVTFQCHARTDEKVTEDEQEKGVSKVTWSNPFDQGLIFKIGDDVRQDMLAVQMIELFKRIFHSVGLDVFVYPYKIIATKPEQGLIEVVPRASSRDQIGKKIDGSLLDYFLYKYGSWNTPQFQQARHNLIISSAGYAVVSYILQIKDRHNGNIMINEDGHLIHIDFGFIFDSSPGGNIGWELSPFKMTNEVIAIIGGKDGIRSESYKYFEELVIRAFLAARQYSHSIITLVEFMLDTKLPCFRGNTINRLLTRLVPDLSERQAANHMLKQIQDSTSSLSKTAAYTYDLFQNKAEGIEFSATKVDQSQFY